MPRRRASSTKAWRSTFPSPERGLRMRTGCAAAATATPGVGLAFSAAMSRPSAYRVDAPTMARSASTSSTVSRLSLTTTSRTSATTATNAAVAPTILRAPARVSAYEAAAIPTARHAAAAKGSISRSVSVANVATSSATAATHATTALALRNGRA